jgi:hypothetical protein
MIVLRVIILILMSALFTSAHSANDKNVEIQYKKFSEFDFSGEKIAGRIKKPAVFYIFQRKRSKEHNIISPPKNFSYHRKALIDSVNKELINE